MTTTHFCLKQCSRLGETLGMKYAQDEWKRIAPILYRLGILTEIDPAVLAAYGQSYGRWLQAEVELETAELVIHGPHGDKPNTLLS